MVSRLKFRNESGEGSAVRDVTFREWLSGLKVSGSNLLVTGEVPETTSAEFSQTLFGQGRRTRILGLLNPATPAAESYLPGSPDSPGTQIIDRRPDDRGTTTTCSNVHRPMVDRQTFRSEIVSAIGVHEERNGGFEPAELRLGVDSVELLEVNDDLVSVGQFLRGLTALVRGVHGMAHYHLRVPDDDPLVKELSPLFDARIELRKRPGWAEQRWHVPELGETTHWVELS
ncbi:hypothetical protein BG842_14100 [Haladaptatus sp. W1]|uniref:DUF7504 family protein n=1 Tax=Haladaptatus sp. W1 TaxID=1897478 RepID=UPI000849E53D|nr:hypothetical protein [Haladaptatus sp. W1]ODR82520.1 hypothetical protein BG842_14100 [Haladaptatus sp. W1]